MFDVWSESLAETLSQTAQANPWIAPLVALVGGLLTAANPCVIAMAPLMIGYVAGQETGERKVARSFLLSLTFAIGLTITFGILFLATWAASSLLQSSAWKYVAGGVCLLMGLHLLGVLNFRIPAPAGVQPKKKGFVGALLLGLLFGLVSMPCAGPVLIALLALVPVCGAFLGGSMLVAYSLGHCGLVLVGGTSMGLVQKMVDSKGWNRGTAVMRGVAGVLIVVVGLVTVFVL